MRTHSAGFGVRRKDLDDSKIPIGTYVYRNKKSIKCFHLQGYSAM
jgi:hypothetical protein